MKHLEFSPQAVTDLDEIFDYIGEHNPKRARAFVASLKQQCQTLAAFPGMGAPRHELAPKLRVFAFKKYGIYYTPTQTGVRVQRVLHAARDVDAFFP